MFAALLLECELLSNQSFVASFQAPPNPNHTDCIKNWPVRHATHLTPVSRPDGNIFRCYIRRAQASYGRPNPRRTMLTALAACRAPRRPTGRKEGSLLTGSGGESQRQPGPKLFERPICPARPPDWSSQSHECSIRRVCRGGLETRRKTLKISGRDSRAERLCGGRGERDGANRPWKTRGKRGRTRTSRVRRSYVTCSNAP